MNWWPPFKAYAWQQVLWFAGPALLFVLARGWMTLTIYVLGWTASYGISLSVRPMRDCRTCDGKGKHSGSFWTYAKGYCTSCGGSGRKLRLGARVLGLDDKGKRSR